MRAYVRMCPHIRVYACVCASVLALTRTCVHMRVYARIYAYMRLYACICVNIRVYARMYAYVLAFARVCARVLVCVCVCAYMFAYTCICWLLRVDTRIYAYGRFLKEEHFKYETRGLISRNVNFHFICQSFRTRKRGLGANLRHDVFLFLRSSKQSIQNAAATDGRQLATCTYRRPSIGYLFPGSLMLAQGAGLRL